MSEITIALSVNKAQAALLLELLSSPQITVPFPKAMAAGELFAEVKRVAESFPVSEI